MSAVFPGERRVWYAAAAVLVPLLALLVFELAKPRDYVTGTNSVASRGPVVTVEPGQELCVPGLRVPAGTGRVRLAAVDVDSPVTVERRLRLPRTLVTGTEPLAAARSAPLDIELPATPQTPESVPAGACVRPLDGPLELGGTPGLQADTEPPTVDGRPLDSRIAVAYLPPRGEETSILARLGEVWERAALFRPGWVGPALYPLLMFAVMPLLLYAALRLLALTAAGLRPRLGPALAVALIALVSAVTWALITPPFNAPDESEHFAYAQYLAETGDPPDRTPGGRPDPFSSEHVVAADGVRLYSQAGTAAGKPPWLESDERRWRERDRSEGGAQDNGGGYTVSASGHQPVYYALLAPGYLAADDASPWAKLTAMRLLTALLGALTALFAYLTVRELAPRFPLAAVAAGLIVALQPMLGFMSASVNNDSGVNAAAAALVYLLVRALRRGLTPWLGAAIGAVLVAMPLLKGTGYAVYPAAALALGVLLWRQRSRADLASWAALAGAFVVAQVGWIALSGAFDRNAYATPGGTAPTASGGVVGAAFDQPFTYAEYLWQVFLPRLPFMEDLHVQTLPAFNLYAESAWGAFGWGAKLFPRSIYWVIGLAMLAVGALMLRALWLEREALRRRWAEAAVLALAAAGVVAGVHAAYFSPTARPQLAEQGRYIFTAAVPLAVAAVAGSFGLGRRLQPVVAAVLVAAVAALTYASRWLVLDAFFA